eukprot:11158010-Lingulodinium_polyedra.AAC.1
MGWRRRGSFWHESAPAQLKRALFICFCQGAALSALPAFVLSERQLDAIDSATAPLLRSLMQGAAAKRDESGA